ncbi:MAG: glycosyltransferase family 4 protein, partial [Kiritimatiellae bacterium]|nr:glycosyltransferase family 4 protein [Kiritimatiellia bacterium]
PERFHVVPIGINTEGYGEARLSSERPVIGYLSNMTESLGLGVMADAFIILKDNDRLKNLKLKVLGGQTPEDRPFLRHLRRKLASKNMGDDVEFLSEFDRNSRIEFIRTLSVMSVPVPHPEAFGMYIVEALACGVPVVQPKVGAFPEIVEATGGGICYEPNDAVTLAKTLESLLLDPECIRSMGQSGRKVVLENFSVKKTAASMLEVYRKCLKG